MSFQKAVNQTAFAKVGITGKPGSGKTTLLALLALYLAKKYHNGAPVAFIDSEKGSDFLIPIFKAEGVELLVEKTQSLADLRTASRRAIDAGACVLIADSITKFWAEAMRALKSETGSKRLGIDGIGRLKDEWAPFADDFVASKLHYLVAGRLGYEWDNAEYEDEGKMKTELVKTGTKMKAEGEFAHDFDLQIEMASIEDPDAVQYEKLRKKLKRTKYSAATMHVATVKKCRVWALNGAMFRWKDQAGYKAGYYEDVAKCFAAYFDCLNIGGQHVSVDASRNSQALFRRDSEQSYYETKTKCEIAVEKWDGIMGLLAGGQTKDAIRMRQIIGREITGTVSKTEFTRQPLVKLEAQVKVLMALEQRLKVDQPKTEDELIACIGMAREESEKFSLDGSLPAASQPAEQPEAF